MKRIDLLGAPGVGKTTIMNSLVKERINNDWLTGEEARHQVLDNHFNLYDDSIKYKIINFFYRQIKKRNLVKLNERKYIEFLGSRAKNNAELIRVVVQHLFFENLETKDIYLSAKRLTWFIKTIEDLILLDEFIVDEQVVILDESLTAKIFSYITDKDNLFHLLKNEANLELPESYIYFEASSDQIVNRLINRNRVKTSHVGSNLEQIYSQTEKEIEKVKYALDILKKHRIKGLVINAELPIQEIVKKIIEFIESKNR